GEELAEAEVLDETVLDQPRRAAYEHARRRLLRAGEVHFRRRPRRRRLDLGIDRARQRQDVVDRDRPRLADQRDLGVKAVALEREVEDVEGARPVADGEAVERAALAHV